MRFLNGVKFCPSKEALRFLHFCLFATAFSLFLYYFYTIHIPADMIIYHIGSGELRAVTEHIFMALTIALLGTCAFEYAGRS